MDPVRPDLVPDGSLARERMDELQSEVAEAATFEDDPPLDPANVDELLVAGVDQAFLEDRAVSAVIVRAGGRTIERVHSVTPLEVPYVPGYLSFREGPPVLAALRELSVEPDLLLFDGSGRIHFRQAGLATHLGVVLDAPSVGVAKRLLCGTPAGPIERLAEGATVAITADDRVDAPDGTRLGYAVQTRQFEDSDRHVNPVFVSPGHRTGTRTAAALALSCCAGYKLPEPVRQADAHAASVKGSLGGS
jgi:deoxyribonuclease V